MNVYTTTAEYLFTSTPTREDAKTVSGFTKYHYSRRPRRPTPKTITEPEITPSTRSTRTAKFVFRRLRNRQVPRRYENNYRRRAFCQVPLPSTLEDSVDVKFLAVPLNIYGNL